MFNGTENFNTGQGACPDQVYFLLIKRLLTKFGEIVIGLTFVVLGRLRQVPIVPKHHHAC